MWIDALCIIQDNEQDWAQESLVNHGLKLTLRGTSNEPRTIIQLIHDFETPTHINNNLWPALSTWTHLLARFSAMKLTYDTDSLPALSGIAQKLSGTVPGLERYVAGMWTWQLVG